MVRDESKEKKKLWYQLYGIELCMWNMKVYGKI